VADELADVLAHSRTGLVVHEGDLGALLPPGIHGLARGRPYESALAASDPTRPDPGGRSGDDEYVLYTGGTTGRPKGVLWRHDDLYVAALGGELDLDSRRVLVACPFFHGTGQWLALATLLAGGTVVTTRRRSIDAAALWNEAEAEAVSHLVLVGDAYARPLVDALEVAPSRWRLSTLNVVLSGGAALSPDVARRLLARVPDAIVVDGYGSSETGGHARLVAVAGSIPDPGTGSITFLVGDDTAVLDDDLRELAHHDHREGWLARRGPMPIGYDHDPVATATTFPVVDGVRWAIPGDRARWAGPGRVEILGRGLRAINTGGENVHPEEVEDALRSHAGVADVIVVGVPDERWGEVVTAVVAPARGASPTLEELAAHCRASLAPFKVPRRLVLVDEVHRSASGKADHLWARRQVV
jgi:acyl-CoA synthetase (AMP-forming)/AMP-acid ligase II